MSEEQPSQPEVSPADQERIREKFKAWHPELQQLLPQLTDDITITLP